MVVASNIFAYIICSALIGASIFISTVVLGTIILIVDVKDKDIGKSLGVLLTTVIYKSSRCMYNV